MSKTKKEENLTANGNGKKEMPPKYERLPKDYEPDESEAAKAFMKAVRMTRKRLYPELSEGQDKIMCKDETAKKTEFSNSNGKKTSKPKYEYLPKDFEIDTSPTALALMKAVRMTRRRLYPELYSDKKNRA